MGDDAKEPVQSVQVFIILEKHLPPFMGVPSFVIIHLGRSLGARSLPLLWLIASAERD